MSRRIPEPLTGNNLCADCRGTGCNIEKTLARPASDSGYVRCWTCNGNGLDPAAYFTPQNPRK